MSYKSTYQASLLNYKHDIEALSNTTFSKFNQENVSRFKFARNTGKLNARNEHDKQ